MGWLRVPAHLKCSTLDLISLQVTVAALLRALQLGSAVLTSKKRTKQPKYCKMSKQFFSRADTNPTGLLKAMKAFQCVVFGKGFHSFKIMLGLYIKTGLNTETSRIDT